MPTELSTEPPAEIDPGETLIRDDAYFDDGPSRERSFDARLLSEPLTLLPSRPPLALAPTDSVKEAMHAMRKRHRGCVLVTEDGSLRSPLAGIFTERDVLLKIIDSGRNPVDVEISEVMTRDPESLPIDARLAWALNMMSVGGYRHVPVVNMRGCPQAVISVRDIVSFLVEAFPAEILNLPPDFGASQHHPRDGG